MDRHLHILLKRFVLFSASLFWLSWPAYAQDEMTVHFIDVGQADATLLEFPCGAVLIDAGAQDDDHVDELIDYLTEFFNGRSDLNQSLDLVLITHNHIDHTRALREVVEAFSVERFIDSGHSGGTGTGDPNWVRNNAATLGITTRQIADDEVTIDGNDPGLSDDVIDPVDCTGIDPEIRVLAGRLDTNPGWPHEEFDNKNNHSITVRLDYGDASFLFSGDLETSAIDRLVERFGDTGLLDVDVYQVGHHGSHNGTTVDLLLAMTPTLAIISMGQWDFGRDPPRTFSTHAYGHPRRVVVDHLRLAVSAERANPKEVMVADRPRQFEPIQVRKGVFATSWDGTVRISSQGGDVLFIETEQ